MVGKMSKDVGMVIRKSINCGGVPTLFGCFFGISSLHVLKNVLIIACYKNILLEYADFKAA